MTESRSSKRYYWLKLNENFFERDEVKIIESMKNGKDYIIFYMKLLLKSVGTEGKLKFRGVIPYTPEMLSSITNTDVDTVKVAIDMFAKLELMEVWDDGTLFMSETQNMIGSETGWAKKKRKQRQEKDNVLPNKDNVSLKKDNVPELSADCPTEIETEIDIDIDIEQQHRNNKSKPEDVVVVLDNKINIEEAKTLLKAANGNMNFIKAKYEIAKVSGYKNLVGFMVKAIENNWQAIEQKNKTKPKVNTKFHNFDQRSDKYSNDDLEKIVERKRMEAKER